MKKIYSTLNSRKRVYGNYSDIARTSSLLKKAVRENLIFDEIPYEIQDGIDNVLHKISRIINNPYLIDNYIDAIGYLTLMMNTIKKDKDAIETIVTYKKYNENSEDIDEYFAD